MWKRFIEWLDWADRFGFLWGVIMATKGKVAVVIAALGGGVGGGIVAGLAAGLLTFFILTIPSWLKRRKHSPISGNVTVPLKTIPFYRNRDEMRRAGGGLDGDLQKATSAWCAFEVGSHFAGIDEKLQRKVTKLLMIAPDSQFIVDWTEHDGSTERAKASVREVSRKAKAVDTDVKWSTKPISNLVIVDPDSPSGYVRVNAQIPMEQAEKWPSYVVTRSANPEFFDTLKNAFLKQFKQATDFRP